MQTYIKKLDIGYQCIYKNQKIHIDCIDTCKKRPNDDHTCTYLLLCKLMEILICVKSTQHIFIIIMYKDKIANE